MRLSPLLFSLLTVLSMGAAGQIQVLETAAQAQTTEAVNGITAETVNGIAAPNQIIQTPIATPLQITGQTGGSDRSACGNIDRSLPTIIRVTEPFASLSFEVESEGDYTLLISGANGFRECVFAHNYDGGVIQAPGLLDQGRYRIFVGDRSGESHPYTLSIGQ